VFMWNIKLVLQVLVDLSSCLADDHSAVVDSPAVQTRRVMYFVLSNVFKMVVPELLGHFSGLTFC